MKIRTGFVSNSSSSSFVIVIKEDSSLGDMFSKPKWVVNEEDIPKLINYGFKKSNITSPFDIRATHLGLKEKLAKPEERRAKTMVYSVTCNQDEVMDFLVSNNIPFKAACHYGHVFMSYKKDADYILRAKNYGMHIDMYGERDIDTLYSPNNPPITKTPKKEYLNFLKGGDLEGKE